MKVTIVETRTRAIVRRGALGSKGSVAIRWMFLDERGFWERRASKLLEHVESLVAQGDPRVHGMTSEQVDAHIADRLRFECSEALLESARRRAK